MGSMKYNSGTCLKGLRKTINNLSHDSWRPGQNTLVQHIILCKKVKSKAIPVTGREDP
jgi:hypothetical protein